MTDGWTAAPVILKTAMGTTDYADYAEVVTRSARTPAGESREEATHEPQILSIRVIRVIRGNFHRRF